MNSKIFMITAFLMLVVGCSKNDEDLSEDTIVIEKYSEKDKGDRLECRINGTTFTMMKVEGGTFQMGATEDQLNGDFNADTYIKEYSKPVHSVTLSDYYVCSTEVTQRLWYVIMTNNPSQRKSYKHPVENVSWDDCQSFIQKLNKLSGKQFRLLKEAEWEYAARGGNKSKGYMYSGGNKVSEVAWIDMSVVEGHQSVGLKSPNELGLYDMSGNVREWCQDWFGDYNTSPVVNPQGPSTGSSRVVRGGALIHDEIWARSSCRNSAVPTTGFLDTGLRLAL